jgi:hypothetical protein
MEFLLPSKVGQGLGLPFLQLSLLSESLPSCSLLGHPDDTQETEQILTFTT